MVRSDPLINPKMIFKFQDGLLSFKWGIAEDINRRFPHTLRFCDNDDLTHKK